MPTDRLTQEVLDALNNLFSDTSVPQTETRRRLDQVLEEIESMKESMCEDVDEDD